MSELISINPYDGSRIQAYPTLDREAIETHIVNAHQSFLKWRLTDLAFRSSKMVRLAALLRANSREYATVITREMGKPIAQAMAEVEKCAWVCDYYANNAPEHLADETVASDAFHSYVRYEPLGVVLAVMPWNYPFWQVFRFAAPALMAGNVCLLKHASNVSGAALLMETIFAQAGFPSHSFKSLLIKSDQVAELIDHPLVRAVTLTGSEPAGAAVASRAGRNIKKSVLELGGNNALIVLDDCDMDRTLDTVINARFQNTGQSCIAGKRLLVQQGIAHSFTDRLVERVKRLRSGDPMDENTYIGTLAREDLAIELEQQLRQSLEKGACLRCGGRREGAWFEPTVLTEVCPGMPVFDQETFGPLLAVTTVADLDEAIALSNRSRFGLGVSLFSKNIEALKNRIADFEEGAVFINELVKSDPRLPFGGIKSSGYGRELGRQGIREFTNVKTVYIKN